MKKIIYIIPILLLIIVLHNPISTTIVESNKYRIPANPAFDDDNFYKCVTNRLGVSEDTNLTDEQLASITELSCYSYSDDSAKISSAKGLEKLTGLTSLSLSYHYLTNIDVSHNTALTSLSLSNNQLTNIDLSHNTALTSLNLYNNQLTSIDLSHNTALTYLRLFNNQLTSIDLSQNTALTSLTLHNNQLTIIDVSNNTNLNGLSVDENVEVIGASDDVSIQYFPIYMFSNNDLKINGSMFKSGTYEYTVNVSNSIDKFAMGYDGYAKGFYYKCPDDTLCGGYYLIQLLSVPSQYGQVTFNDSKIDLDHDSLIKEVLDYWEEIDFDTLKEEQCPNEDECDVYYNDKLVASIQNDIATVYKDDKIIAKVGINNTNITIYKDGKEIYVVNGSSETMYAYVADLKEGTNVLKIKINADGIDAEYTINIIRSKKELNNDPSKELEDIAKEIVDSNNIDYSPDTGLLFNVLATILGISIIGVMYYIYYKGKVKS